VLAAPFDAHVDVLHVWRPPPHARYETPAVPDTLQDAFARASRWQQALAGPDGRWSQVHHVDFLALDATPELREFARRYQDRFGLVATVPDALNYDAMRLVLAGIQAGARTGDELRAFLESLGRTRPVYQGVTGPIRFDDLGEVDRSYVLATVGDGLLP
jgi:ABC-type branched-subunit amino acid transport system substrate-binding protein